MKYARRLNSGVGHLSPEKHASLLALIAEETPSVRIMAVIGCTKQVVSYWRAQMRKDTSASRVAHSRITQLCLVNECHEEAKNGKYCVDHQCTPGKHGAESNAPMGRLMGSR